LHGLVPRLRPLKSCRQTGWDKRSAWASTHARTHNR